MIQSVHQLVAEQVLIKGKRTHAAVGVNIAGVE